MNSALLRTRVESTLGFPLTYHEAAAPETLSIPVLDQVTGGVPRGGLTEICGAESSGRTALLLSIMAKATGDGELCALLDSRDALDPHSAAAAGVDLSRLLWVRCREVEPALRSAALLLEGGGFGVVALDLAGVSAPFMRRISLSAWFRLRGAVRNTRTALVVLEREPTAGTSVSLVVRLEAASLCWSDIPGRAASLATRHESPSHAWLLSGLRLNAEVLRARHNQPSAISNQRSAQGRCTFRALCNAGS